MKAEKTIPQPDGLHSHNFKCCDTMGGAAFRDWCYLYHFNGVFIGFRNHEWVVYVSSDPKAEFRRGCQESSCYGSPMPKSENARIIHYEAAPAEVQKAAYPLIKEAIKICLEKIRIQTAMDVRESEERKRKLREERERLIDNWS